MTVKVQLSAVGINTTTFDIYSNFNNVTPIASGISKMALLAGYYLSPVPDGATTIRVVATGTCTNYTDMPISGLTTTTTTTTATPTTTTSTTANPTTTTAPPSFYVEDFSNSTPISNCAGAGASTYPITLYVANLPISLGDIVYSNNTPLANPFQGDGTWYSVNSTTSFRINASGEVIEVDDCTQNYNKIITLIK